MRSPSSGTSEDGFENFIIKLLSHYYSRVEVQLQCLSILFIQCDKIL